MSAGCSGQIRFDNSIAARVPEPLAILAVRAMDLPSWRTHRFIQLNLSDCTRSRVKKGAIRDDWQAFVFLGHAGTFFSFFFFLFSLASLRRHSATAVGHVELYIRNRK